MSHSDVIVGWILILKWKQEKEFDEKGKDKHVVQKLIKKWYIDHLHIGDKKPDEEKKKSKKKSSK